MFARTRCGLLTRLALFFLFVTLGATIFKARTAHKRVILFALQNRRIEICTCFARQSIAQLILQNARLHFLNSALSQFTELERAVRETDETVHIKAERFKDALDFAVLAFTQTKCKPAIGTLHAIKARFDALIIYAINRDALAQCIKLRLIRLTMRAHAVATQPAG